MSVIQLHVLTVYVCICRLGDVLSSLTSKKEFIPYENSMLTKVLSDSLGTSFLTCKCSFYKSIHEALTCYSFGAISDVFRGSDKGSSSYALLIWHIQFYLSW